MVKLNCWEFKKCGMEKDQGPGKKTCPVPTTVKAEGINSGRMAGRACWVVAGTFCNGKPQGAFAEKIGNCLDCEFYQKVVREEGEDYTDTSTVYLRLNKE